MDQYTPDRYLPKADGSPFYYASATQTDGDLNVLCPTKCELQHIGVVSSSFPPRIVLTQAVVRYRDAPAAGQAWQERADVL